MRQSRRDELVSAHARAGRRPPNCGDAAAAGRGPRANPPVPSSFTLLVPRPYWDPDTEQAADTLELAVPLLDEAAGGQVEGIVGDSDPFAAVEQALEAGGFDENHHLHTSGARVALAPPRPPPIA
jgi:hypothetical protein